MIDYVKDTNVQSIMRMDTKLKYSDVDLYIYNEVDITQLIPNTMSEHRWEGIINEIEHIVYNANTNTLYVELPLVVNNMVRNMNNVINPWEILNIDKVCIDLLKPIISVPISYMIYDRVNYVEETSYIDISLLSFVIVCSYFVYKLMKYIKKVC
jgi:hypothetical protein